MRGGETSTGFTILRNEFKSRITCGPGETGKVTVVIFRSKIRWTKYDLIIKLITRIDRKSRDESIKPN